MNVRKNTTLCDGDMAQKLVQLLIIADGELEMTGDDTSFLVVTRGIASQLEYFCGEVLQDGGEIDGGTCWQALEIWNAQSPLSHETHQHQHAERSSLSSTDGGRDRRGMRDQPWMNGYKSNVSQECIDHQCSARPRGPNKSRTG